MPATEAQIRANKLNAQKSTGPRTEEGKEASRANAYKHGLTASVVMPEREAAEVKRRTEALARDLQPSDELSAILVERAATLSVRMERCVFYEKTLLTARVRQAEADFVPPEGISEAEAARLRSEAGTLAMFDPSKEATLARKYEASAERGFFRAIKELQLHEKALKAEEKELDAAIERELSGSFDTEPMTDDEFDELSRREGELGPRKRSKSTNLSDRAVLTDVVDVPIAVGKRP